MNPYNSMATIFSLNKKKNDHPVNMDTKKIKLQEQPPNPEGGCGESRHFFPGLESEKTISLVAAERTKTADGCFTGL